MLVASQLGQADKAKELVSDMEAALEEEARAYIGFGV